MTSLFCYNCLSELHRDVILLQCRDSKCEYHTTPARYASLLDEVRAQLRRLLRRFPPKLSHPLVLQLRACPHINWSLWDGAHIRELCLPCLRCPGDYHSTFDLLCPICKAALNQSLLFNDKRKIIPVFGGPYSGKTVLIRSLVHSMSTLFDQHDRLFCIFNKEGRDYVYANGSTAGEAAERLPKQNERRSPPIILYTERDYRILYDVPGKWMAGVARLTENAHLFLERPVVIILLDPYSIPALRRYLPAMPENTMREAFHLTAEDAILNLIQVYRKYGKTTNGRASTSLYVVFAKADLLGHLGRYHPDDAFKQINQKLFSLLDDESRNSQLDRHFEDWLKDENIGLSSLLVNAKHNFAHIRYFPVSALGGSPLIFEDKRRTTDRIAAYSCNDSQPAGVVRLGKALFNLS